ncbi:MAG TPA: ABC transporter ATP-binding protein [Thermoplasmata archaeon]|nr:ABC transporter ATP-binding protein [Thermoplasmata archaeon]
MEHASPPLTVDTLTVRYGAFTAVDRLSLTVRPGEIYGLLGANGAGKSSTIRTVVGLQPLTSGAVRIFGIDPSVDPVRTKASIGYVPETTLLFDALSPKEFLEFVASVRRLAPEIASERAERYARGLGIETEFGQPLATLSGGTRQKVLVIAALLHQPPLLILDEPLNNLDPRTVRIMKELLADYVRTGNRGVLFSTHTMEVAQQLCHRVGILDHGQLRGEGSLAELRRTDARGEATLEEIYLRLTDAEGAVHAAVRELTGG